MSKVANYYLDLEQEELMQCDVSQVQDEMNFMYFDYLKHRDERELSEIEKKDLSDFMIIFCK